MKILVRVIAILLLIIISIGILLISTNLFDVFIKYFLIYEARNRGYQINIGKLTKEINKDISTLLLQNVEIYDRNNHNYKITVNNLNINADLIKITDFKPLNLVFTLDKVVLNSNNHDLFFMTSLSVNSVYDYHKKSYQGLLNVTEISSNIIHFNEQQSKQLLHDNQCKFKFENLSKVMETTCQMKFDNTSFINTNFNIELLDNHNLKKIHGNINVKNVPLIVQSKFSFLLPKSELWQSLTKIIQQGHVNDGKIFIELGKDFFADPLHTVITEQHINGEFNLSDMKILYHESYPIITKLSSNLRINGSNLDFAIPQALSLDTKISNGTVNIDWQKYLDTNIIIKGETYGPAKDLVNGVIPSQTLQQLKAKKIDLSSVKGYATSKFDIVVPVREGKKNQYNVKFNFTDNNLTMFNDKIQFKTIDLIGTLKNYKLILDGKSRINNLDSTIFYEADIESNKFSNTLKIDINIDRKLSFPSLIKITDGNAIINFKYYDDSKNSGISIQSDLTNLGFNILNTPFKKMVGSTATLEIKPKFNNVTNYEAELHLYGTEKLNVQGTILVEDNNTKINFSNFKFYNSDLSADINIVDDDSTEIEVQGSTLDLSMDNNLEGIFCNNSKEPKTLPQNLEVQFNYVKLQHDINLKDLYFHLQTDKFKIISGTLHSYIGQQPFTANFNPATNQWIIRSANAGAVIRGLNINRDIISGQLVLILNMNEPASGYISGELEISNFISTNTTFMTRLVSFLSLPGVLNIITRSDDIKFKTMNLKFNYKNGVINITDGSVKSMFMDFSLKGIIDINQRIYKISGMVYPDLYGINRIAKITPIIGLFLGKGGGIIAAPYSISEKF